MLFCGMLCCAGSESVNHTEKIAETDVVLPLLLAWALPAWGVRLTWPHAGICMLFLTGNKQQLQGLQHHVLMHVRCVG